MTDREFEALRESMQRIGANIEACTERMRQLTAESQQPPAPPTRAELLTELRPDVARQLENITAPEWLTTPRGELLRCVTVTEAELLGRA